MQIAMKKKITKTILIVLAYIVCTGCSDVLDITPDGRMTLDDVFKNTDYTESYLNSIYEYVRKYRHNYHYYSFLSSYTDDAAPDCRSHRRCMTTGTNNNDSRARISVRIRRSN